MYMMKSQLLKFVESQKHKYRYLENDRLFFLQIKKIIIKDYFMAKNSFVVEVNFNGKLHFLCSVSFVFGGEWPSGLKRYFQNWKFSVSNPTKCFAVLSGLTSLRGTLSPLGRIKNKKRRVRFSLRQWSRVGRASK